MLDLENYEELEIGNLKVLKREAYFPDSVRIYLTLTKDTSNFGLHKETLKNYLRNNYFGEIHESHDKCTLRPGYVSHNHYTCYISLKC